MNRHRRHSEQPTCPEEAGGTQRTSSPVTRRRGTKGHEIPSQDQRPLRDKNPTTRPEYLGSGVTWERSWISFLGTDSCSVALPTLGLRQPIRPSSPTFSTCRSGIACNCRVLPCITATQEEAVPCGNDPRLNVDPSLQQNRSDIGHAFTTKEWFPLKNNFLR